jgi:hypothetical protein
MTGKSKMKRLMVIIVVLAIASGLAYLTFVDVTPTPEQVNKEIDLTKPEQR